MYKINISHVKRKNIYDLGKDFQGVNRDGHKVGFTNYYMTVDNTPYFGITGEIHFSRMDDSRWEDELIKMKMCGVNIIATYIFWIHHEEIKGRFDFSGCRNLRKFVELCGKYELYVIIRIGPFDHGEVRNGGLPDWLYGMPFETRSTNEGFMDCVRLLYQQISGQVEGLLYHDGGPVIAAQLDNEYMHSSSTWEMTTGVANEWINGGDEGEAYINCLREEAGKAGIITPFYTCTAWGGAIAPDYTMPLWGGYAYRPWLFYNKRGEHPSTKEYIYQDYHNNDVTEAHDFSPRYLPEERPYACCEMGGGMMCSYNYRFIFPEKSVDAMANIKTASGCNFLGYYMFHGGTNPKSKLGIYLNESQVSKVSYDFQAALGEFGQLRSSYRRLKTFHYFCRTFAQELLSLKTMLPNHTAQIVPEDLETLRFAVRTDGQRGFVFLNNFQDHEETLPKSGECIEIICAEKTIVFEDIGLAPEENCVLPFFMELDFVLLKWATAQPVTVLGGREKKVYIFMKPDGMDKTQFYFEEAAITDQGNNRYVCDHTKTAESFTVTKDGSSIEVLCIDRRLADQMYVIEGQGLIFTEGALLKDENGIRMESLKHDTTVYTYPPEFLTGEFGRRKTDILPLGSYSYTVEPKEISVGIKKVGRTRYTIVIPDNYMVGVKDVLLQIEYEGDIGQAFIQGEMIHDNFYNGAVWEIGLKTYAAQLKEQPLTIYITPIKEGVNINVDSPMAGRMEEINEMIGALKNAKAQAVYEIKIR